jgi:hypothetical protein
MDTMLWKYKVPTTNINNWTATSFNDATWLIGKGGFGFGDADDSTIISTSSISVYVRKTFTIIDTADLYNMVLNIDYDDGFVAYINGKPIVNIGLNNFGNYNNLATTNHEAQMYQGSNPDYFFFDEATNSLDANNEKTIVENLNSFFKGKTAVIVAHRLSTVKNADNIIVLEKGKLIEQGTHNDLVARKGAYYELVKNQLELGS